MHVTFCCTNTFDWRCVPLSDTCRVQHQHTPTLVITLNYVIFSCLVSVSMLHRLWVYGNVNINFLVLLTILFKVSHHSFILGRGCSLLPHNMSAKYYPNRITRNCVHPSHFSLGQIKLWTTFPLWLTNV
jgi:hypothetical protein